MNGQAVKLATAVESIGGDGFRPLTGMSFLCDGPRRCPCGHHSPVPKSKAENLDALEKWLDGQKWRLAHFRENGLHYARWISARVQDSDLRQDCYADGSWARSVSVQVKAGFATEEHISSDEQVARIAAALAAYEHLGEKP